MKTCKFCNGKLVHRIEKGFIETYELDEDNKKIDNTLTKDLMIDLNSYNYCSNCEAYVHKGLIIDGRNTLDINLKLFDDILKKEKDIKAMDLFRNINLINFKGSQVLELNYALIEKYIRV